jgi:YesN/AraC family two-component response regulator
VTAVKHALEMQGFHVGNISLGEVIISENELTAIQHAHLDSELKKLGFEIIDDRKARIIEAIKNNVIRLIHHHDNIDLRVNWSQFLADELHYEYNYLSSLFSSVEGITLEQYIIRQKIERVKELLFYDELNLSEIANKLGYSSVAHLSSQFKKITGLTPTEMKKARSAGQQRKPLDNVL